MKIKPQTILALLVIFLLQGCSTYNTLSVDPTKSALTRVAANGQILIDALKQYKLENNEYPESVDLLIPKHIKSKSILKYRFTYMRADKCTYPSSETDSWNGYQIRVAPLNGLISKRSCQAFIYNPAEYYPERKFIKPKVRINNWVLVKLFGKIGTEPNPITGPGV